MDEILTKVAKVKELLPQLKDPARIAKAAAFLAAHGEGQLKSGFIGGGTGNQQEGLAGIEDKLPAEKVTATMPENPSLAGEVGSSLGSALIGFDNGAFAGIPHRAIARSADVDAAAKAAELTGGDTLVDRPGVFGKEATPSSYVRSTDPRFEGASDMADRVETQDPLSAAAGAISSMALGGLPALFDSAASRILSAVGMKAAPRSAIVANAVRRGITGAAAGAASGATQDAVEALDQADRHPEVNRGPVEERLTNEAEKLAIQAMLSGGLSSLVGAAGARAAALRDSSTNTGAGGVAQKVSRLEAGKGKLGLGGVTPPPSTQPLYQEAMAGGQAIPEAFGAPRMSEGPNQPGAVGELFRNNEPPAVTRPALDVRDVAAEKALVPVQAGINEVKTDSLRRIQNAQDRFLKSSAQYQQVEPTEVTDVLRKYIKARTFKEGAPVPYANSGEPIQELNKLLVMGDPVSSAESAAALQRNPKAIRLKVQDAIALGLRVNGASEAAHDAWVVAEPRSLNPEQFESAMQGINKAAAESKTPDALHADLQHAGFLVRQKFEWPADAGPKPGNYQIGNYGRGMETVNGWAAVQARAHDLLSETETKLYRIGTNPADALGETRGADAIRNSLRSMGEPGRNRADDALWGFAKDQPGGRETLYNMEALNAIEGPGGLRSRTMFTGLNPLSAHNRAALGLRLDPTLQWIGSAPTAAAAVAPGAEALQPYLQQLLQGISARMGR